MLTMQTSYSDVRIVNTDTVKLTLTILTLSVQSTAGRGKQTYVFKEHTLWHIMN